MCGSVVSVTSQFYVYFVLFFFLARWTKHEDQRRAARVPARAEHTLSSNIPHSPLEKTNCHRFSPAHRGTDWRSSSSSGGEKKRRSGGGRKKKSTQTRDIFSRLDWKCEERKKKQTPLRNRGETRSRQKRKTSVRDVHDRARI